MIISELLGQLEAVCAANKGTSYVRSDEIIDSPNIRSLDCGVGSASKHSIYFFFFFFPGGSLIPHNSSATLCLQTK